MFTSRGSLLRLAPKFLFVLAMSASLAGTVACQPPAAPTAAAPTTDDEKSFYALGSLLGKNISVFSLSPAELEMVKQGLTDQVTGKELKVDLEAYRPKLDELAGKRRDAQAAVEKEKAKAFLDKAATEAGAQKKESGLVYTSITEGTGAMPTASDVVKVHYKGTLTDGTAFDSSYDRGQPAEFPLGGVIKCWTEGVAMMKVGGKAKLVCPSDIAYGDRGRPPKIPGGATLVFEVELLEVVAQTPPAAAPEMPGMPGAMPSAPAGSQTK